MSAYFIGFDCGTMGTKVALYDLEGHCLAEAFAENEFFYPHPNWVEMDAGKFYENVVNGMQECLAKSGVSGDDVKGISASGIVDGAVPVDEDFNPAGPFIPYLDMRAQEEAREIRNTCEPIWEEESAKAGLGPDCVPMVMSWLFKHNVPYISQAKKFCNIAPYVLGRLGGFKAKDAFVDWSHASGWLVGFDLRINDWSRRQFKLFGVPEEVLPRVVAPGTPVGSICKEVAAKTGLREGTPLIAGAGDLMVSTLGAGVVEPGQSFDVAGTSSIMSFISKDLDAAVKNRVLLTSRHVFEDELIQWGCLPSGGLARGWYRDGILNLKGITQAYPMMDSLADTVPAGAMSLLFAPYLSGSMTPTWAEAKGAWMGLTPGHNQAHLWRAMMESVAFEYRLYLESLEQQGLTYERVVGVGGGAKSAVWNQLKADMLEIPYTLISTQDTGALGNCLIAAYGTGYISDMIETVKKWTEETRTFHPRPEYVEFYHRLFEIRQEILQGPMAEIYNKWDQVEQIRPPQ